MSMRASKESIERYQALLKEREDHKKELSELRNKVIEQAIDICKDYEVGWQVADIIEKLNSLKTK